MSGLRRPATQRAPASVQIMIVSYNTASLLAGCLASIAAHQPPAEAVKLSLAVLDNGSSDGSADLVRERFPAVRLVQSTENLGFAAANNRLAAEATADYLMLLNSDTRFTEDIITPLVAVLASDPAVRLVAPRLVYPDGRVQLSSERFPTLGFELARQLRGTRLAAPFASRIETTLARYRRRAEVTARVSHPAQFLWATCWLVRREDVLRYGLFDERFVTYDEDLDFCRRLSRRRAAAWYVADVELVHIGGASSTTQAKRTMVRRARQRYYRRHATAAHAAAYALLAGSLDRVRERPWRRLGDRIKGWKVWELDGELRYMPVVAALPASELPVCEVGSGPRGLAAWTPRRVVGVDPGPDERHGQLAAVDNLQRVAGDGAHIPLPDRSVAAAVAVDTFEHIPREDRPAVAAEMQRVVAAGGRLIIIGPTGPAAAAADARVLARWRARGESSGVVRWLSEHQRFGLPTVEELVGYAMGERAATVTVTGAFNARLWWLMHRALLGDFSRARWSYLTQLLLTHPFAALARRWHRGPYYRYLVVADLDKG